jgi:hypothetical protein
MFRIKFMIIMCSLGCGQVTMPPGEGDAVAPDFPDSDASDAMDIADAAFPDSRPVPVPDCPELQPFELSWGTPVPMSVSDVQKRDLWPSISCDDKELYFTQVAGLGQKLFVARRAHRGEPWSVPQEVAAGGDSAREPEIAPGGKELYFNTETALRELQREDIDTPWVEVGENITGRSPALTGDGLTLYYIDAWNRYQLMRRQRSDLESTWGPEEPVRVPNDWRYQQVTASPDGSTLLLFQPVDLGNPWVVAVRDSTWVELPELNGVYNCDLSWHGDLVCSDNYDLIYIPNAM